MRILRFIAALALASVALTGCASRRDHPVACTVAGAIIVGSVAATVAANDHGHAHTPPHMSNVSPPNCGNGATCE
jgi:hypothetical protein